MNLADVNSPAQVEELAERILSARTRPLVLVSTDADGSFLFEVERLRTVLAELADVITIETGSVTRRLEDLLPPKTHAFGGAARSYPADFGQNPSWTRSNLRFPLQSTTDDLVDDAMAQLGRRTVKSVPPPSIRRVHGVVQGFIADGARALVRLDDGTVATATGALLPPDLPLLAALVIGGPVSGILKDTELRPEPLDPDLDAFADGDITLALVVKVTNLRATVQLHPRIAVVLRRRDVDVDEGPVSEALMVGDVIRVRVRRETGGAIALSHVDIDPEAPLLPALALVKGGAPWLSEDRPQHPTPDVAGAQPVDSPRPPSADVSSKLSAAPVEGAAGPDVATRADITALAREVAALRGDMLALTNLVARSGGASAPDAGELARLRTENEQLRARLAQERAERASAEARLGEATENHKEAARALRDARRAAERSPVDTTPDGIRFEIERTWANRTASGERERWPLREYTLGPGFIASLDALDEGQLAKAVRACVDAITGRDREIPARELHRLRSGEGGDDPYVVRADGARCWRSSVEQNAPGARRLHYWELAGGVIELSRIVHHDDTKP